MLAMVNKPTPSVAMTVSRAYRPFVAEVRELVRGPQKRRWTPQERLAALAATNGAAGHAVEELLTPLGRSSAGAFFTTTPLARRVMRLDPEFSTAAYRGGVLDPACGAGDLLLAVAATWPLQRSLAATVREWEARIHGVDSVPAFVRAARLRLILLAALRGGVEEQLHKIDASAVFRGLRVGNGLEHANDTGARTVILNPPFTRTPGNDRWREWSDGQSVSLAAAFVDSVTSHLPTRGRLVAVLPDVLRSGAQFRRWREYISSRAATIKVRGHGRFSPDVDVDVFLLALTKAPKRASETSRWPEPRRFRTKKLGSMCKVSVGSVVPHRTENRGNWVPFLTAGDVRNAPNGVLPSVSKRFVGRLNRAPFVAVQRTSAPSDRRRPVAAIVRGRARVAVENHLIILHPVAGTVTACRSILRVLQRKKTREWLDKRYRCRHLTVEAIREVPVAKQGRSKRYGPAR